MVMHCPLARSALGSTSGGAAEQSEAEGVRFVGWDKSMISAAPVGEALSLPPAAKPLGSPNWRPLQTQKLLAYSNQRTTPPLRLAKCRLRRLLACIAPAGVSVSPFGLPAFNRGMIATGNHDFERLAALCNTPEVEPRRLRRSGRLRAAPTGAVETGGWRVAKLATPTSPLY